MAPRTLPRHRSAGDAIALGTAVEHDTVRGIPEHAPHHGGRDVMAILDCDDVPAAIDYAQRELPKFAEAARRERDLLLTLAGAEDSPHS